MSNILDGLTIDDVINNNKDTEINIETLDDSKVELMQKKLDDGSIFELTLKEIFSYLEVDCKCKLNKIYQATISVEYTLSRKVSNSSSGL